jgi:hypothetical protein
MVRRSHSRRRKIVIRRITQVLFITIVILLLLLIILLVSRCFLLNNKNNYFIDNKYYSFRLAIPDGWVAEFKTIYSQDNIAKLLKACENDNSGELTSYEIGRFRFASQKYPQTFGQAGYTPKGISTGAMLDMVVSCPPKGVKNEITNYSSNLKIGGEGALVGFLNLLGLGKVKYSSFLHNGLQYKIGEYIYIAPSDQAISEKLRKSYSDDFNKIRGSLKF